MPVDQASLRSVSQRNIDFFCQEIPALGQMLRQVDALALLNFLPDGDVQFLHPAYCYCYSEYLSFEQEILNSPGREYFVPFSAVEASYLDNPEEVVPHQAMGLFKTGLDVEVRRNVIHEFLRLAPTDQERFAQPTLPKGGLGIGVLFGGVAGQVLQRVVSEWQVAHLVVAYSDLFKFILSLFFTDYPALFAIQRERGFQVSLALAESPAELAEAILETVQHTVPGYFFQVSGVFLSDHDSAAALPTWTCLREKIGLLYRTWGFCDDEMLGMVHAAQNIQQGIPLLTALPKLPEGAEAVLVGNGPSLDMLEDWLRGVAGSKVIFAVGSAISALARKKIRPDFLVLTERTDYTSIMLKEPETLAFLADVPILGLNVVPPEAFRLSSSAYAFLKLGDSAAWLVDPAGRLPQLPAAPSSANAAFAFMLAAGFNTVYLAGMDLGFKDARYHHSRSSMYLNHVATPHSATDPLSRIVSLTHQMHAEGTPVPANFAGEVLSTPFLMQTRDALAHLIAQVPGVNVLNMSDGAHVPGAQPCSLADFVARPESGIPAKSQVMAALLAAFAPVAVDQVVQSLPWWVQQSKDLLLQCRDVLSLPCSDRMSVLQRLVALLQLVAGEGANTLWVNTLVQGGIAHLGRFFLDGFVRLRNDEAALSYFDFFCQQVFSLLIQVQATLAEFEQRWMVGAEEECHAQR